MRVRAKGDHIKIAFEIPRSSLTARFREDQEENELVTNVFVGNLDITVTEQQLRELFAAHGAVETITIVRTGIRANPEASPSWR